MSALDSGQSTLGIVWVHNGVAESKGGISWGAGNDTTGVGTPTAPYLTHLQALKEIRADEGQKDITKTWEIRLVTDDDETNDYGETSFGDDATIPDTNGTEIMILSGWLKAWGDTARGKWATIAERPKHDRIVKTTAGTNGGALVRWVMVDIEFTSSAIILVDIALNAATFTINPTGMFKAYGCTFDWTTAQLTKNRLAQYNGTSNTVLGRYGLVGCFFKRLLDMSDGMNDSTSAVSFGDAVNCSFIPRLEENCLNGNGQRRLEFLNCILSPDGIGSWAFINETSTTFETVLRRHHMRYHMRGGSGFMRAHDNGTADFFTFTKLGGFDDESSSGDPLLTSISNPTITDASPSLDKGGIISVIWADAFDPTNNNFHEVDILRYAWGDSLDFTTPVTADGDSKYSHRAIGCHQNLLGTVPPIGNILFPIGIINQQTVFVTSDVPQDPDLNGTLQFRVLQADNGGMTDNLIIKDSCPLAVSAAEANNKINFKEDGGGEFTATIPDNTYTTDELMAEIVVQLEAAGAGTYTATFDSVTELTTLSVSGAIASTEYLFQSGTDIANSIRIMLGFISLDVNGASVVGTDKVLENFFSSALTFERSADYTPGLDPAVSGTWLGMGTGLPSDSGVEGTNGVLAEPGTTRFVRVDLGTTNPVDLKYHAIQFWSGTLKSQDIEV